MRSCDSLQSWHFPSSTTTPFELVWDEMTRRRMDDLFSGKSQDVWDESASYLSRRSSGSIWPFSRTPIHGARHVRVRSNKSVIESVLSPSSSYGNASVPRPTRNRGCSLLLGFFLLILASPRCHPRRRPRSNLNPIAGSTTISIPPVTKPAIYGGDLLPYL